MEYAREIVSDNPEAQNSKNEKNYPCEPVILLGNGSGPYYG